MESVPSESNKCLVENEAGKESVTGQLSKEVIFGDLVWVKRHAYWWPAQVVDGKTVSVVNKPSRKRLSTDVLVRLYGSYIYKYVDIHTSRAEFKNILRENNFNHIDILKKSLERDLPSLKSDRSRKRQQTKSKGTVLATASQNGSSEKDISDKSQAKVSSKKQKQEKDKTAEPRPKNKNGRPHDSEPSTPNVVTKRPRELSARRTKVMQSLGLIAPSGSPFPRNGLISPRPTPLT